MRSYCGSPPPTLPQGSAARPATCAPYLAQRLGGGPGSAGGEAPEHEEIRAGRLAVTVIGVVGVIIALMAGKTFNVQILTGLAFAVAASANFPALLLSLTWRRLTTTGTVFGILVGLISSIVLIVLSPQVWSGPESAAPFPLGNPAIVTVPLGFIACIAGSLLFGRDEVAEATFDEVRVRSTTGIGSERAWSPAEAQSSRPTAPSPSPIRTIPA